MARCKPSSMESILPFSQDMDDGTIFIDEVKPNGDMRGRHRRRGASEDEDLQNGKCKENDKKFECERVGFRYEGDVFAFDGDDTIVIIGRRSPKQKAKREEDGEEGDGDEVWVGVKTGT